MQVGRPLLAAREAALQLARETLAAFQITLHLVAVAVVLETQHDTTAQTADQVVALPMTVQRPFQAVQLFLDKVAAVAEVKARAVVVRLAAAAAVRAERVKQAQRVHLTAATVVLV